MNDETRDRPSEGGGEAEGRQPVDETPATDAEAPKADSSEASPSEAGASETAEAPGSPEAPGTPETAAAAKGAAESQPKAAPTAAAPATPGAGKEGAPKEASPKPDPPKPDAPKPSVPKAGAPKAGAPKAGAAKAGADDDDPEAKAAAAKAKAEAAAKAKAAREAAEAAKPPWERVPKAPEWEDADDDPLSKTLRERHPEAIESTRTLAGDLTVLVRAADITEVCATLKAEGYTLPVDICGAHYPDSEDGEFEVIYHLYSFDDNRRIRAKVRVADGEEVPSVTSVWVGANWHEREVYDMYGVRFSDHPDLSRLLLWEGFNGYPLRKDFPVEGIDTGSAIYPEYYEDEAGPVAGTGTGWKPPEPPEPPAPEEDGTDEAGDDA